jgi:hypothetical protein
MKLISCWACASVFDQDKMDFCSGEKGYLSDGSVDLSKVAWDGDDFVAYLPCPVCSTKIMEE